MWYAYARTVLTMHSAKRAEEWVSFSARAENTIGDGEFLGILATREIPARKFHAREQQASPRNSRF